MTKNPFLLSLLILFVTLLFVFSLSFRSEPTVLEGNLKNLPFLISGLNGTDDSFPADVMKELNTDEYLYRHYSNESGNQIDLYIGYYGTAKGGRSDHNPFACFSGSGWGILEIETINLNPRTYSNGVSVNFMLAKKEEAFETILHWYQSSRNKVIARGIEQNIQGFLGRIIHNRNDGAFVRVSVLSGQASVKEARGIAMLFAENVLDLLPDYWPVEK